MLIAFALPLGIGCDETTTDNSDNSTTSTTETTTNNYAPKTKEEIELEAAKALIDLTTGAIKKQQQKDSAFKANRDKEWVYQIGEPINNEKSLLKEYKQLKNIRNICVFKQGGTYLIIKKDNQPKEVLYDSLGSFKSQISTTGLSVDVIDIMANCRKRKTIVQSEPIRNRKEDLEIKCFVCDK